MAEDLPTPQHAPLVRLLRWAADNGMRATKLALDPADPRGLMVSQAVAAREAILTLPQSLLMHAGTALSDPEYGSAFRQLRAEMDAAASKGQPQQQQQQQQQQQGQQTSMMGSGGAPEGGSGATEHPQAQDLTVPASYWDGGGLSDRDVLCMLLVLERARGTASRWSPYIDILPTEYDDPYWWDDRLLGLVRGTRLARAVQSYRPGLERIARAMRRLKDIGEAQQAARQQEGQQGDGAGGAGVGGWDDDNEVDWEWATSMAAARWARSAVWSRSFTVRGLAEDQQQDGQQQQELMQQQEQVERPRAGQDGAAQRGADAGCGSAVKEQGQGQGQSHEQSQGQEQGQGQGVSRRRLVVCQVPVLDMIDHGEGCSAAWHTGPQGRDDFEWLRLEPVEQGVPLRNNYGSKDNCEFLLAYGFVLQPNRHDYVAVTLAGPDEGDRAASSKAGGGGGGLDDMDVDGGGTMDADGGGDDDVEALQEVAEAAQRRLVAAAAGLPRELRLTLSDPLPEQLLQATRVALSSGHRLYLAAAEALCATAATGTEDTTTSVAAAGGSAAEGVDSGPGATGQATSSGGGDGGHLAALLQPYDSVSELRVLDTVLWQLEGRMNGMVSEGEAAELLGLGLAARGAAVGAGVGPGTGMGVGASSSSSAIRGLLLPESWASSCCGAEGDGDEETAVEARLRGLRQWCASQDMFIKQLEEQQEGHGQQQPQQQDGPVVGHGRLGRHARMALAVVNGQRAILSAAVRQVQLRMARLLQDASARSVAMRGLFSEDLQQRVQTGIRPGAAACAQPGGFGPAAFPGSCSLQLVTAAPAPAGDGPLRALSHGPFPITTAAVLQPAHEGAPGAAAAGAAAPPPLSQALWAAEAGQELARVSLAHCLAAPNRDTLVMQLSLAAYSVVYGSGGGGGGAAAGSPEQSGAKGEAGGVGSRGEEGAGCGDAPAAAEALVRQLLCHVPLPPVGRLLLPPPSATSDGSGGGGGRATAAAAVAGPQLLAVLQGSPIAAEWEQQAEELQDSFNAFRQRLSAQLESQDQQQQQEEEEDAGGEQLDSAGAPGQPHRWALRQLLRAAGSAFLRHMPPQDAFRLYCWAAEVVQSCSMEVEVEPEAGTGQQQQRHWAGAAGEVDGGVRPRRLVCIAPVAWCVPKEVRQAILRPQLVQQPPAAAVEPPTPTRGAPQPHLVLRAACPLPPGLVLHRGLLLPSTRDADALMSRYGPEALALVKQQQQQQQEGQQQQQQQHGGRTGLPSHHSALGPPLHSLVITPAEQQDEAEDQEEEELAGGEGAAGPGGLRLRLLQQCGVGAVHYLGPGGAGRGLLTAALQLALLDLGPDTQQGAAGATGAAGSMAEVYPAASWLRSSCQANGEQATGSGASLQQQEGGREQGAAPGAQKQDEDEDGGPATVTGTRAAGTQEGQGSGGGGAGGRAGGGAPAADVGALMHARRVMADLLLRPPGDDTRGAACRKQLRKTVAAVAKDAGKAAKAAAALQAAAAREGGPDTASCTGVARYLMSYSEGLAGYLAAVQAEGEGGGGDGGKGSGREKEGKGRGREKEGKGKRSGGKGSGKGRGAEDGAEAGSGKAKRAKTKA